MNGGSLFSATRYCEWLTAHHYENFPVASRLLPARLRPHVAAVYAFARAADDFADEARYQGRSLELLQQWRSALWACVPGGGDAVAPLPAPSLNKPGWMGPRDVAPATPPPDDSAPITHPIFIALADTVRRFQLPVQWLDDLLTAFTMDVTKRRYADWEELLTYCRYSANPVGRLVLALFGIQDPELQRLSDDICTGLQMANHWQDLRIDIARDILYIPQTLLRQYGVTESELRARLSVAAAGDGAAVAPLSAPSLNKPGWMGPRDVAPAAPAPALHAADERYRALMAELVARARALFDEGEPLTRRLRGGLRLEIKLTVLGGRAVLDRIEKSHYDVFRHRPAISTFDKIGLLMKAVLSR